MLDPRSALEASLNLLAASSEESSERSQEQEITSNKCDEVPLLRGELPHRLLPGGLGIEKGKKRAFVLLQ